MGHDEDGDEVRTLVVDWLMQRPMASSGKPAPDPWTDGIRTDQRASIKRLRQAIMETMASPASTYPFRPTARSSGWSTRKSSESCFIPACQRPGPRRGRSGKSERIVIHQEP